MKLKGNLPVAWWNKYKDKTNVPGIGVYYKMSGVQQHCYRMCGSNLRAIEHGELFIYIYQLIRGMGDVFLAYQVMIRHNGLR